jgi:transposase InsO family protein
MQAKLVNDALVMALWQRTPGKGLIWHTDRGSQYASASHRALLNEHDIIQSMSRKGNCWDNAPTESWFNSFKNERIHGVRYRTHAEMKAASFEYIEVFYNRQRQHSTLGYQSPAQYMQQWNVQQQQAA